MYKAVKSLVKMLPEGWVWAAEPWLRRIWALAYAGKQVHCTVCGGGFRRFIFAGRSGDPLCPACGSLPRSRWLTLLLDEVAQGRKAPLRLLHLSPERSLKRKLRRDARFSYQTSDYESKAEDHQWDLTALPAPAGSFDLIICFHILEHIPDDRRAIGELYRVLAPGGCALVQTPFHEAPTLEHPDALEVSPAERLRRYGQEDHVRVYNAAELGGRLREGGFDTELKEARELFSEKEIKRLGLQPEGKIWLAKKGD